ARVMLTSRKAGDLEESAAHLKAVGIEAIWIAADLSLPSEIVRVTEDAIARLGHVDILINNAGATWGAAAEDHPLEAWDKVMNLNIRSIFLMSQAVGKHSMIPRKSGKIINVASIAGLAGSAELTMVAYHTSKAAVVNFTRSLAGEWGKYGINVNALAPGFFPSRMTKGVLAHYGADNMARHAPLRRLGDDDDLKGATLLFASQAGKHITGQILPVDGGVSAVMAA
ncbi:MAG: SDR family oxidoreductase, partial [Caldimonas sp.]